MGSRPAPLHWISKKTIRVEVFHRRRGSLLFYTPYVFSQCLTRVKLNRRSPSGAPCDGDPGRPGGGGAARGRGRVPPRADILADGPSTCLRPRRSQHPPVRYGGTIPREDRGSPRGHRRPPTGAAGSLVPDVSPGVPAGAPDQSGPGGGRRTTADPVRASPRVFFPRWFCQARSLGCGFAR